LFVVYVEELMESCPNQNEEFKWAIMCVMLLHFDAVYELYPEHILVQKMLSCRGVTYDTVISWGLAARTWFVSYNGKHLERDAMGENDTVPVATIHEYMQNSIKVQKAQYLDIVTLTREVHSMIGEIRALRSEIVELKSELHNSFSHAEETEDTAAEETTAVSAITVTPAKVSA
jgi:hypothetical protein